MSVLTLIGPIQRAPGSTDFSDITTSVLTAEPVWVGDNQLELTWDVEPTAGELARVLLRICTPNATVEQAFIALRTYFRNASPTAADTQTAVKALARILLNQLSAAAE